MDRLGLIVNLTSREQLAEVLACVSKHAFLVRTVRPSAKGKLNEKLNTKTNWTSGSTQKNYIQKTCRSVGKNTPDRVKFVLNFISGKLFCPRKFLEVSVRTMGTNVLAARRSAFCHISSLPKVTIKFQKRHCAWPPVMRSWFLAGVSRINVVADVASKATKLWVRIF